MDNRRYFVTERDRKGQEMVIRAIQPDDKDALREAFSQLAPESRYFRFCFTKKTLSDSELAYFTEVDGHLHQALVAYRPDGESLAVARWVRQTESPVAEFAVTVADNHKRQGIGSILLYHLAINARREGVQMLQGQIHAENTAMLGLLSRLPWQQARRREDQCQLVTLTLPNKLLSEPRRREPALCPARPLPPMCADTYDRIREGAY